MRVSIWIRSVALVCGSVSLARAQNIQGTDSYEGVARSVIEACNENPALTFLGGGSENGEWAMNSNPGTQDFAPMTLPLLKPAADSCGVHIADDPVAIYRSPSTSCTNVPDARHTLRTLYFGCTDDSSDCHPSCGSSERRELISHWNWIYGCGGSECSSGLRHAFRPSDVTGTAELFRQRLGISGFVYYDPENGPTVAQVPLVPFCNGNDVGVLPQNPGGYAAGHVQQDLDPVRTPCIPSEDVCGPVPFTNVAALGFAAKTLGVVLTIDVPTAFYQSGATVPASATDLFNPVACTSGAFALAPNGYLVAPPNATATCPDGSKPIGGSSNLCFAPLLRTGSTVSFNCTANPVRPASSPTTFDGRANNVILRDASGGVRNQPPAGALTAARRVNTAYYRLHTRGGAPGPGRPCLAATATELIGCMVSADPCSIGLAGSYARIPGANQMLSLDSVPVLSAPNTPNSSYLLYRQLWVNALHCPSNVAYPYSASAALHITQNGTGTDRQNMVDAFHCFRTNGTSVATSFGFYPPQGADVAPTVVHY